MGEGELFNREWTRRDANWGGEILTADRHGWTRIGSGGIGGWPRRGTKRLGGCGGGCVAPIGARGIWAGGENNSLCLFAANLGAAGGKWIDGNRGGQIFNHGWTRIQSSGIGGWPRRGAKSLGGCGGGCVAPTGARGIWAGGENNSLCLFVANLGAAGGMDRRELGRRNFLPLMDTDTERRIRRIATKRHEKSRGLRRRMRGAYRRDGDLGRRRR